MCCKSRQCLPIRRWMAVVYSHPFWHFGAALDAWWRRFTSRHRGSVSRTLSCPVYIEIEALDKWACRCPICTATRESKQSGRPMHTRRHKFGPIAAGHTLNRISNIFISRRCVTEDDSNGQKCFCMCLLSWPGGALWQMVNTCRNRLSLSSLFYFILPTLYPSCPRWGYNSPGQGAEKREMLPDKRR
jgi:hypothetical protein